MTRNELFVKLILKLRDFLEREDIEVSDTQLGHLALFIIDDYESIKANPTESEEG